MARYVDEGAEQVFAERFERGRRPAEDAPPACAVLAERALGGRNGLVHRARRAVVERMGAVDLGPAPLEAVAREVERLEERRPHRHRMHSGAVVVDESGNGRLAAPRTAADRVLCLEDRHLYALARERHRARQPVRAGSNHDRAAHATGAGGAGSCSLPTTSTGISNDSSSHGPRLIISATDT